MDHKELRRMSRSELLQLLMERTRENDCLQEQLTQAQHALERARTRLDDRTIALRDAGSIAEAALRLNGVWEAAQRAAEDYLSGIERMRAEQEQQRETVLKEARDQAGEILTGAKEMCAQMEKDARRRCEGLLQAAERDAHHNWDEMNHRLEQLSADNAALREMLQSGKKRKWL